MAKKTPEQVTAEVVRLIYENEAMHWSIQDKGIFVAAIKLQLSERTNGKAQAAR